MNANGWYASQAKSHPDLFRVIFDFNRRPQHWLHPDVVAAMPEATVIKVLAQGTHGQGHLASWLLRVLHLEECETVWDFQEPRRRLALLSPDTLSRLARYLGAALCWPRLAAIIGRQQLQDIKAELGEDVHAFALRRARLIVPAEEALPPAEGLSLSHQLIESGWQMLAGAADDEEESIHRRLTLKLPPEVARKLTRRVSPELREQAWSRVRQVSREVLTAAELKCFA